MVLVILLIVAGLLAILAICLPPHRVALLCAAVLTLVVVGLLPHLAAV